MNNVLRGFQKTSLPVKIFYLLVAAIWAGAIWLTLAWYLSWLSPVKLLFAYSLFFATRWFARRRQVSTLHSDTAAVVYLVPVIALIGALIGIVQDVARYGVLATVLIVALDLLLLCWAVRYWWNNRQPAVQPEPVHWSAGCQSDGSTPQVLSLFDMIISPLRRKDV